MQAKNANPALRKLVTTVKVHNKASYVMVQHVYNKLEIESTHYECNCSIFENEADVIAFINEVF